MTCQSPINVYLCCSGQDAPHSTRQTVHSIQPSEMHCRGSTRQHDKPTPLYSQTQPRKDVVVVDTMHKVISPTASSEYNAPVGLTQGRGRGK